MATGRLPDPNTAPLTAKGDLYTYSTVPARLAVGSNGDTLVADSSTTTGLRWQADWNTGKNKIINGDFFINQRNFSSSTTALTYGFDRFDFDANTGTVTYSAQTFTPGAAPVAGYEARNFARLASTGQNATSGYSIFQTTIEDVRNFAGQTATLSFWAKADSGTPKVAFELQQQFGTGGSPSSGVLTYGGQVTLSTSWQRYSITINVPSISGKTIGTTANTSYLRIGLWTSAGTNFNARTGSLGIQTATIDFWGLQFEAGSVATPFTTATGTLAGELAACQRYYYRITATASSAAPIGLAYMDTANAYGVWQFPVVMRTAPTCSQSATTDIRITWSAGVSVTTGLNYDATFAHAAFVRVVATGLTSGQAAQIRVDTGATKWIEASAEL